METRMNLVSLGEHKQKKGDEADLRARRHTQTYHIFQLNMLQDWIQAVKDERLSEGDSPAILENLEAILDIANGCAKVHRGANKLVPIVHYELGDWYAQKTDSDRHKYQAYGGKRYSIGENLKQSMQDNYSSAILHMNKGTKTDRNGLRVAEVLVEKYRFARRSAEVLNLDDIHFFYASNAYKQVKFLMSLPAYYENNKERIDGLLARIDQDKL